MGSTASSEEVDILHAIRHVLLLHPFRVGGVVLVILPIPESFHEPCGGIPDVQGYRGHGSPPFLDARLGPTIGMVYLDGLGRSGHVHHCLCKAHLAAWEIESIYWTFILHRGIVLTSHSGIPMNWHA